MTTEEIRLRIGNLAKAVLVTGQAYQDPKDALNEFISNAADEYLEAGLRGGRITVVLRRQGRHPVIAVDDSGRGMSVEELRRVASNLFESGKASDPRTLGEKAIGILAFQQLGGRCDIVTRPQGGEKTHALRLERGTVRARLELDERRRARVIPGTTVYLSDLDPEAVRGLTLRRLVDYLQRRRGVALARGDYQIEVVQGRSAELVNPEPPDGVRLPVPQRATLLGPVEFGLYLAPRPDHRRRVALVGRAGTTIVDDLCELEEFDHPPWNSDHVGGQIIYEPLQQSAGRRAILRDREAFPALVQAVQDVEVAVGLALDRVTAELDRALTERISEAVRQVFARVLRELADLDNPMHSWLGTEPGDGGLMAIPFDEEQPSDAALSGTAEDEDFEPVQLEPSPPPDHPPEPPVSVGTGSSDRRRSRALPTLLPDPEPTGGRSRFDPEDGIVYYNEGHPDFLLVKEEEAALLDYLATLVAKEYVVYNHPRSAGDELGEEMVRMLVRVRRHLLQGGAGGRRPRARR
ncbi:MAG: ATP-binding protein [Candidatus Dormibacteria bacterium]|jgi:hypothetical protein